MSDTEADRESIPDDSDASYSSISDDEAIVNVNPNEENFAGLEKIVKGYESWDWIFGKSPKFLINTSDGSKYPVINGKVDFAGAKEKFSTELIDKLRQSPNNNDFKLQYGKGIFTNLIETVVSWGNLGLHVER